MARIKTAEFGNRVCNALGLDPERVKGLEIRIFAGEVLTVRATLYAHSQDGLDDIIAEEIKNFRLVEE